MKPLQIIALILLVLPLPAYGEGGWEGGKVKVKKDALLCDYFMMEKALILEKAGDNDSIQALISSGRCLRASNDFFATVTKDASTYTDPNLAEIMIKGTSIWGAMKDMECCYK